MSATTLRALVADAGDARDRAVRVGRRRHAPVGVAVAEDDAAIPFERGEQLRVGVVVALAMGDRHPQDALAVGRRGERRRPPLDAQVDPLAMEREVRVPEHRAGQQAGLEQHLEAVADPEHRHAARGGRPDRAHDRRMRRHRAGPQVVAVAEAAGQDDRVVAGEVGGVMTDEVGADPDDRGEDVLGIAVAVAARERHDRDAHR